MIENELYLLENEYYKKYDHVIGIDEAGRGPLAGPLVVAACCLGKNNVIPELDDSKKINSKKREDLFDLIKQKAVKHSIVVIDNIDIDRLNIFQATMTGMKQAAEKLNLSDSLFIFDGNHIPSNLSSDGIFLIKADAKIASVAAASIIAKVTRDKIMTSLDQEYPNYNFKKNKGYPTKEHIEAIRKNGLSPVHRKSFRPKALNNTIQQDFLNKL